jgi:hypothetical protein
MYAALMTNNSNVGMVEFLMAGEARGGGGWSSAAAAVGVRTTGCHLSGFRAGYCAGMQQVAAALDALQPLQGVDQLAH